MRGLARVEVAGPPLINGAEHLISESTEAVFSRGIYFSCSVGCCSLRMPILVSDREAGVALPLKHHCSASSMQH
jgi:hypothetical protein